MDGRMYYAAYNYYGTGTSLGMFNVPELHIFFSKRERDDWVEDDWSHRQEITYSEFRKWSKAGCVDVLH